MILGEMNAKVGKEKIFKPAIGRYSAHEVSNNNALKLTDFAISKNMTVSSTHFDHKNIHKVTWTSLDGMTQNQIDHILVDRRRGSDVMDVRMYKGSLYGGYEI
jgi:hypothetical protein